MKITWLDRALVVSPYYYTLCTTPKRFKKVLVHLKVPADVRPEFLKTDHADATVHFFESEEKLCAVLCMPRAKDKAPEQIAGLIAHEAVHLWQAVRDAIGEKHPSSEFEAYSVQAITQRWLEEYNRQTK